MPAIIYTDEDLINLADKLLTHIEGHLDEQFRDGRIQGTDYAQVYIAGIQASMAQAQAFLLGKDIAGGQASILTEQRLQAEDQTTISVATVDERIALIENQKTLLDEQIVQAVVQGDIIDQQALQAVKNTSLVSIQEEIATSTKDEQIAIIENQKLVSDEQIVQLLVQGNIQDDQKLATAEQALQAVKNTSLVSIQEEIADATKDEQIAITGNQKLLSDEQVIQTLVQGDIIDQQALQAVKNTSLVSTQDEIVTATKDEQIAITANQKLLSDEQVVQLLVQGDIQDDQKLTAAQQVLQATKQTSLVTTQDEIVTATKNEQIAIVSNQKLLSDEKLVQSLVQGNIQDDQKLVTTQQTLQASKQTSLVTTQDEVATSVKQNQIDGVAAQTELAEEELRILKERHGINLVPQYP